jgi:hypothetical protein
MENIKDPEDRGNGPDKPSPHKVLLLLTASEWRALRVAAAEADTSIQGYVTDVVLRALR